VERRDERTAELARRIEIPACAERVSAAALAEPRVDEPDKRFVPRGLERRLRELRNGVHPLGLERERVRRGLLQGALDRLRRRQGRRIALGPRVRELPPRGEPRAEHEQHAAQHEDIRAAAFLISAR
jgi:hypothetical protein